MSILCDVKIDVLKVVVLELMLEEFEFVDIRIEEKLCCICCGVFEIVLFIEVEWGIF